MRRSLLLSVAAIFLVVGLALPLLAQEVKGMYITVRRYEGVTDPKEIGRRVNDGFVPLISQVPGFIGYYWVDAEGRRDNVGQHL